MKRASSAYSFGRAKRDSVTKNTENLPAPNQYFKLADRQFSKSKKNGLSPLKNKEGFQIEQMIHDGSQPSIPCTAIFGQMDRDYGKLMLGDSRFNPACN